MGRLFSLLVGAGMVAMMVASTSTSVVAMQCGFNGLDFSSLSTKNITIHMASYSYEVRVCGVLDNGCGPYADSAACQIPNGQPVFFDIADAPQGGKLDWTFIDSANEWMGVGYQLQGQAQCWLSHAPQPYTTNFHFVCSGSANMATANSAGCETNVTIPTPLACKDPPPTPTPVCYFEGRDLSSLSTKDISIPFSDQYTYDLRVCGVLDGGCGTHADGAACQVDTSRNPTVSYDIGNSPQGKLDWNFIDQSNQALGVGYQLQGATQCWVGVGPQPYYTNVNFVCASSAGTIGVGSQGCVTNVTIPTPHACPPPPSKTHHHTKRPIHKLIELF